MIEVEVKIRLLEEDLKDIRQKILKVSEYSHKTKKVDQYFTLEDLKKYPEKSLRVRKLNGIYQVNFKERISYTNGVHAKRETEFEVSDIKGFFRLINNFGFKRWLVKEKLSEIYKIKKNFHIELNNVKNLGWFLEIEYLTDEKNIKKARGEIVEIMEKLGINSGNIVEKGYTKMLWDKGIVSS